MDIRHYLSIARRQRWVIIEAVVIVALLAGAFAALQTREYKGAASVLLRADDLEEADSDVYYYDADRYVAGSNIVRSRAVANQVAESLGRDDPRQLGQRISVAQKEASDILEISFTDPDPVLARDIANGFAAAYIQNRRNDLVGNLQRVSDRLEEQLASLQAQIAEYDDRIEAQSARRLAEAAFGVVPPRDEALEAARSRPTARSAIGWSGSSPTRSRKRGARPRALPTSAGPTRRSTPCVERALRGR